MDNVHASQIKILNASTRMHQGKRTLWVTEGWNKGGSFLKEFPSLQKRKEQGWVM